MHQTKNNVNLLIDLPIELIYNIFFLLDMDDLLNCRMLNKHFNNSIKTNIIILYNNLRNFDNKLPNLKYQFIQNNHNLNIKLVILSYIDKERLYIEVFLRYISFYFKMNNIFRFGCVTSH